MSKRKMKLICGISGVVIILLLIVGLLFINDIELWSYEARLKHHKLPEATERIELQSTLGRLSGNGNGLQFLSTMLIRSDLSFEELEAFYGDTDYQVIPMTSADVKTKYLSNGCTITYDALADAEEFDGYYAVIFFRSGHTIFHELDARGH